MDNGHTVKTDAEIRREQPFFTAGSESPSIEKEAPTENPEDENLGLSNPNWSSDSLAKRGGNALSTYNNNLTSILIEPTMPPTLSTADPNQSLNPEIITPPPEEELQPTTPSDSAQQKAEDAATKLASGQINPDEFFDLIAGEREPKDE